jgi:hypothetical protein
MWRLHPLMHSDVLPEGPADECKGGAGMPRYMVERTFKDGLLVPLTEEGAASCLGVVERDAEQGVCCFHSYVSEDKMNTFCI